MEWLKPAIAFMALSSAVVAASFLYVGTTLVRKRYVLLWAFAWLASIPQLAFTWRLLDAPGSELAWTLQLIFLAINTQMVAAGCYMFVRGTVPLRPLAVVSAAALTWALSAPRLFDDFFRISLPGSLLFGLSYLWIATNFLRLHRQRRTRGSRLLAILFLLAGLHEFDYPLFGNLPWAAPAGYALAACFGLAIGLGLLVMVLEESRADADGQRARVGAILENLPIGVVVTAPDGHVQILNGLARAVAESIPGARTENIAELEPAMFRELAGERAASADLPIGHSLHTGKASLARELLLVGPDGSLRQVLVNAGPVRDAGGAVLGAIGVFQDVQELKRMQHEVARSQKLQSLGTLAAGVAHDFNNALTMILGHAELAHSATADPAVREQLEIVSRVAADSAATVRRLQDVARTRVTRDNVTFDLATVVREVVDIARPRWRDEAQARGLHYDVQADISGAVPIAGQPAELREALLNLTFNAIDAMPSGGRLTFTVKRAGSEALLTVSDDGVGMSAEVRERIFDPFFTTKGQRGTGLGLSVVFSIVERHSGRIEVASQVGQGTTFRIRFPLVAPSVVAALPGPAPAADGRAPARARSRRLLVVDDESLVRTLTASLLKAAGHEVETAEGGEQALKRVQEREFDIVLTDLGMPGMNGWEVTAAVRAARPGLRVVLVTGWGETISHEAERAAGVSRVLSKPFTRVQLLECVEDVMRAPEVAAVH